MKKLYCGASINTNINTEEAIFQIVTFDEEIILCNLKDAKMLLDIDNIRVLKRYWNHQLKSFSKLNLKKMK